MVWLSILGGVCNRISARERRNMSRTTDRAGRNKGQWIVIGFMAFAIIVISICTVIFRSYVRGFHKVTDREIYDRYYVMITEDRKSDFWQSVYRGAFERGPFILGVLPLVISHGAGSGAQNAVGTGVMGGMFAATVLAIYFVPVFFVVVEHLFARFKKA